MQPTDNSQLTEEQRAEAFRTEALRELHAQTKTLGTISTIMIAFTTLFVIGVIVYIAIAANGSV